MSRHMRVGDEGQRYIVQTLNWPKDKGGWQNSAYSLDLIGAEMLAVSLGKCPSCDDTRVLDREDFQDALKVCGVVK